MEKSIIRYILKKEGYKKIRIDESAGWDYQADKELIEVKETSNKVYYDKNYYSFHTNLQKELYFTGKSTILFIFHHPKGVNYKFLNKYKKEKTGLVVYRGRGRTLSSRPF